MAVGKVQLARQLAEIVGSWQWAVGKAVGKGQLAVGKGQLARQLAKDSWLLAKGC